jgi:hypothetical protein
MVQLANVSTSPSRDTVPWISKSTAPGGQDEGGGEDLCLLLDGHVDGLDGLPGGIVPHHHGVAVAVPLPAVLNWLHVVRLPPALVLLQHIKRVVSRE